MRFLCSVCKSDTCTERGSDAVFEELKAQVKAQGLEAEVQVQRGGCYGLCKLGPNLIVREGAAAQRVLSDMFGSDCTYRGVAGEFHYAALATDEIARVVEEHLGEGNPIVEFLERKPKAG